MCFSDGILFEEEKKLIMRYIAFLSFLFLLSCNEKEDVQFYYHGFENNTWAQYSPIEFEFHISDTSIAFNLNSDLRYNKSFPFNSLNMSVSLITPSGSSRFMGVSLEMKEKDGSFKGLRKEDYIELPFTLYKGMKFNETGKWLLIVTHKMPIDINRGLVGIEFELEKQ